MDEQEELVVLKVKGSKDPGYPKKVANAICWQLRDHGRCEMRAIRDEAVASAVKAIATANKKVEAADVTLSFDAVFAPLESSEDTSQSVLAFTIQEVSTERSGEVEEYRVSARKHSDEKEVSKLAGAIASEIRKGKTVVLRCVGPFAIYKSVRAVVMAKGYVFANGILTEAIPSWKILEKESRDGKDIQLVLVEVRSKKA